MPAVVSPLSTGVRPPSALPTPLRPPATAPPSRRVPSLVLALPVEQDNYSRHLQDKKWQPV